MAEYFKTEEVLSSYLFADGEAATNDFELNRQYAMGEIEVGPNEHSSAFIKIDVVPGGVRSYESGITIISYLPEEVINEI